MSNHRRSAVAPWRVTGLIFLFIFSGLVGHEDGDDIGERETIPKGPILASLFVILIGLVTGYWYATKHETNTDSN